MKVNTSPIDARQVDRKWEDLKSLLARLVRPRRPPSQDVPSGALLRVSLVQHGLCSSPDPPPPFQTLPVSSETVL